MEMIRKQIQIWMQDMLLQLELKYVHQVGQFSLVDGSSDLQFVWNAKNNRFDSIRIGVQDLFANPLAMYSAFEAYQRVLSMCVVVAQIEYMVHHVNIECMDVLKRAESSLKFMLGEKRAREVIEHYERMDKRIVVHVEMR